jgi:membrane protein involved in colicin uptake
VRQGRTDAWIAHQLEVTVQQIQAFKREQSLEPGAGADADAVDTAVAVDFDDEIDLRAEDDALIAAELDAEAEAKAAAEAEAAEKAAAEEAEKAAARAARAAAGEDEDDEDADSDDDDKPKRRRGRRGGRTTRRKKPTGPLEGTFDHGEEGYGLWLDPSIQDDPTYAEYWAGHRPVEVVVEEDQIIIRRVVSDAEAADEDSDEPETAETATDE